ncbi:MAG: MFS transporter [Candidatus Bathyarchaeia archaeon]
MQTNSLKILALTVGIFFFTNNLSTSFLPVYYMETGLSVTEITQLLLSTFIVIGLLPITLLKLVKNFEKIIAFGILSTALFFATLIYIKNPIILGLTYGLGIATFWPSFNLLQFRLSETQIRARTVSLFSSIIPSIASIIGPAVGGFVASTFGFPTLFAISILLYITAFLFSRRIKFQSETHKFTIPKNRTFKIFFISFILLGLSEAYWLTYPLFLNKISGGTFQMGLVLAASAVLICTVTFLVNWLSDIKRTRVNFAIVGAVLNAAWYFSISFASTPQEIVALSLLSGFASAFSLSWFAHYGDSFSKEYHASILVMLEAGLMIGRILNLAPTNIFISTANYTNYFTLLGLVWLLLIPIYLIAKRTKTSAT